VMLSFWRPPEVWVSPVSMPHCFRFELSL
jgi:hypothetical protein